MTTKRYCIFVIPAEHRATANVLLALVNGDDPAQSNAFRIASNVTGDHEDPATHYHGGMPVTEEWLGIVSNLATDMVDIPVDYNILEADAVAAAAAIYLQVTITQDDSDPSPTVTQSNALSFLGLQLIVWPD